jgi:hypothetical protein
MEIGKIIKVAVGVVALLLVVVFADKMAINVDSDEIVITQDPIDGDLHIHTSQGMKNQNLGSVVGQYHKSNQYNFDIPEDLQDELSYDNAFSNPEVAKYGIKVRFNDDGDAYIFGSMRYDLPLDEPSLEALQTQFGSRSAIENDIVRRTVNNAVFNAGPLMSSKESSAEKRSDLLWYIEDMSLRGAYKTKKVVRKEKDPVTGDIVDVKYVVIQEDSTNEDMVARQVDKSQFEKYKIVGGNFTISQIIYSPNVEKQIEEQQKLTMKVQIAKAKALEAQQNEITAEASGKAKATQEKWTQEAINAKEIAMAEKNRDKAKLAAEEAEFYKKEQKLIGEGDAARKRAVMQADGALKQKLAAYVETQKFWADAYSKRNVPQFVMGGESGGSGSQNDATTFMQLQNMKVAKDLGLNLKVK